jgi:hypothetical protein
MVEQEKVTATEQTAEAQPEATNETAKATEAKTETATHDVNYETEETKAQVSRSSKIKYPFSACLINFTFV